VEVRVWLLAAATPAPPRKYLCEERSDEDSESQSLIDRLISQPAHRAEKINSTFALDKHYYIYVKCTYQQQPLLEL